MLQRYISRELTHFVGRNLGKENKDPAAYEHEHYELLKRILDAGELSSELSRQTETLFGQELQVMKTENKNALSTNQMYSSTVVCFCDIPLADFHIHMTKYSRFGISFLKTFLIERGANPVFYIAKDAV